MSTDETAAPETPDGSRQSTDDVEDVEGHAIDPDFSHVVGLVPDADRKNGTEGRLNSE